MVARCLSSVNQDVASLAQCNYWKLSIHCLRLPRFNACTSRDSDYHPFPRRKHVLPWVERHDRCLTNHWDDHACVHMVYTCQLTFDMRLCAWSFVSNLWALNVCVSTLYVSPDGLSSGHKSWTQCLGMRLEWCWGWNITPDHQNVCLQN